MKNIILFGSRTNLLLDNKTKKRFPGCLNRDNIILLTFNNAGTLFKIEAGERDLNILGEDLIISQHELNLQELNPLEIEYLTYQFGINNPHSLEVLNYLLKEGRIQQSDYDFYLLQSIWEETINQITACCVTIETPELRQGDDTLVVIHKENTLISMYHAHTDEDEAGTEITTNRFKLNLELINPIELNKMFNWVLEI